MYPLLWRRPLSRPTGKNSLPPPPMLLPPVLALLPQARSRSAVVAEEGGKNKEDDEEGTGRGTGASAGADDETDEELVHTISAREAVEPKIHWCRSMAPSDGRVAASTRSAPLTRRRGSSAIASGQEKVPRRILA
mmetsp:Transcript_4237/g.10472  ORF Transcript_4237/g.10472 Transcript_4237/m.10472 type:complete len:135 (+) Transcript_4237:337-741(+)